MKHSCLLYLVFLAFTSCIPSPKKEDILPPSTLFKTETERNYTMSPCGKFYAFTSTKKEQKTLQINYLDTTISRSIYLPFLEEIEQIFFWKDFAIIITKSCEKSQIWTTNINTETPIWEKGFDLLPKHIEVKSAPDSSSSMSLSVIQDHSSLPEIWEINLLSGKGKRIYTNSGNVIDWIFNSSEELAGYLYLENNKYFLNIGNSIHDFGEVGDYLQLLRMVNNDTIEFLGNKNGNYTSWNTYDLKTKKFNTKFQHPNFDINQIVFHPSSNSPIAYYTTTWKDEILTCDKHFAKIKKEISSLLENKDWKLISTDKKMQRIIVRTFSDKERGNYFLFDSKENSIIKLRNSSPWLNPNKLSQTIVLENKINEQTVYSYLYLPKTQTKNTPTIIYLHDGPWTRSKWEYNPLAQYFCSLGYAFFDVNYLGSFGFGKKYQFIDDGDWAKSSVENIKEWTRLVIDKQNLNEDLIYLYGKGFGGHLSLECKKQHPTVYLKTVCDVDKWKSLTPSPECGKLYLDFFEKNVMNLSIFNQDSAYMQLVTSPQVQMIYRDKMQDSINTNPFYVLKMVDKFYKK